jgi:glycosyltransferase involved in cell wall biosynthesis
MRIAQVSPLYESVPPKQYGGTERVVSYLTEELVRLGHDVTLFASGDSVTSARLVPACPRSLRLDPECIDQLAHHLILLERVFREADSFDLVHFHCDYLHFPLSRRAGIARLTTLHGRLDLPDLASVYREFPHEPLVSISGAQRRPLPWVNWRGTVHHGLPDHLFRFHDEPGDYLAFVGRICPEKGIERAIEIARRSGLLLRIAAKVDRADRAYYEERIRPMLKEPGVEYIGEITDEEKCGFMGRARALLFPVDWPEPFGLAMIESMACGTPVVAWRNGSVPEVIEEGVSGRIVQSIDEAVRAVEGIDAISRFGCRRAFEERFRAERMARDYLEIYARIAEEARPAGSGRRTPAGPAEERPAEEDETPASAAGAH